MCISLTYAIINSNLQEKRSCPFHQLGLNYIFLNPLSIVLDLVKQESDMCFNF